MTDGLLRALVRWWRADFDFTWIPEFLERRSLTLPLRWVVGVTCLVLGICCGLLLISEQRPQSPAQFWALAVVGASSIYAAVRWPMARWPTETRSLIFLLWADAALTTVVWFGIHSPELAVPACGVFFISGLYATVLHSPRIVIWHTAYALSASGCLIAVAITQPGADVAFLAAESIIVVGVIVFPVALHAALQFLKHDAATSYHDPLTDLLNRRGLADRIEQVLEMRGSVFVTLVLDLNGFKQLNDEHGHDAGDLALRELAARLAGATPPGGSVGRLGGDEFAVMFMSSVRNAEQAIESVRESAHGSGLSASVGVWMQGRPTVPAPRELFHEVVKRADFAMYEAKRSGAGLVVHC